VRALGWAVAVYIERAGGSVVIKDRSTKKAHVLIGGECYVHGLADRRSTNGGFECRRDLYFVAFRAREEM
jgi:hypothetical protein